jgi:hypothetical protein
MNLGKKKCVGRQFTAVEWRKDSNPPRAGLTDESSKMKGYETTSQLGVFQHQWTTPSFAIKDDELSKASESSEGFVLMSQRLSQRWALKTWQGEWIWVIEPSDDAPLTASKGKANIVPVSSKRNKSGAVG